MEAIAKADGERKITLLPYLNHPSAASWVPVGFMGAGPFGPALLPELPPTAAPDPAEPGVRTAHWHCVNPAVLQVC